MTFPIEVFDNVLNEVEDKMGLCLERHARENQPVSRLFSVIDPLNPARQLNITVRVESSPLVNGLVV